MRKLKTREDFVKFWAKYVKTHRDEEWSKQQNRLINSQIKISRDFFKNNKESAEKYIKELRRRNI